MNEREFYDYIQENFNLGGTASRLVYNIIQYVRNQEFVDAEDAQAHLKSLLDGAFGIVGREIKLYRAPECEVCGELTPYHDTMDGTLMCSDCVVVWDLTEEAVKA